jgi:hypothetical protein
MKNPIRAFLRRYDPDTIGELSKISVGDAFYDPARRAEVAHLSSVFRIEAGPFTGVHIIRDEDPPRRRWWQRQRDTDKDGAKSDGSETGGGKPNRATPLSTTNDDAD